LKPRTTPSQVGQLADDYFNNRVLGKWKHPNIVRARIENDIKPNIGKLAIEDVRPGHIDLMLKAIIKRGAPTMANDVLRWTRRRVTTPLNGTCCNITPRPLLAWRTLAAKKRHEAAH
jgi:hypothetical protein